MKPNSSSDAYVTGCKAMETQDYTRAALYHDMGRDDDAEMLSHRVQMKSLEAA